MDIKTTLVVFCVFIVEAWSDQCREIRYFSNDVIHHCEYGCCHNHGDPCCDPPYYTGATFIITLVCTLVVPLVMGIVLCLVIRQRRRQRLSQRRVPHHLPNTNYQIHTTTTNNASNVFHTGGVGGPYPAMSPTYMSPDAPPAFPPTYYNPMVLPPYTPGADPDTTSAPPPPYTAKEEKNELEAQQNRTTLPSM